MRVWTILAFAMSVAISLVAVAAPSLWVKLIFGQVPPGASGLIYAFAIRNPLWVLFFMAAIALRTESATRVLFWSVATIAAVSLVGAYPLVLALGIWGAGVGSILCQAAGLAVALWGLKQTYGSACSTQM